MEDQVHPPRPAQDIALVQGEHQVPGDVEPRRTTGAKAIPSIIPDLSDDEENGSEISERVADEAVEKVPPHEAPPNQPAASTPSAPRSQTGGNMVTPGRPSAYAPSAYHPQTGEKGIPSDFKRVSLIIKQLMSAGKEEMLDNLKDAGLDTDGTKKDVQARLMLYLIDLDVDKWHKRCEELFDTKCTTKNLEDRLKFLGEKYKGREKPYFARRILQAEDRQDTTLDEDEDGSSASSEESKQDETVSPIEHTQREQTPVTSPIGSTAANETQKRKSEEATDAGYNEK